MPLGNIKLLAVVIPSLLLGCKDTVSLSINPETQPISQPWVEVRVQVSQQPGPADSGYCVTLNSYTGTLSYASDVAATAERICPSGTACKIRVTSHNDNTVRFNYAPRCPNDILTAMLFETANCKSGSTGQSNVLAMNTLPITAALGGANNMQSCPPMTNSDGGNPDGAPDMGGN